MKVVEIRLMQRSRVAEKEVQAVQDKLDAEKQAVAELKEEIAEAEADAEAQAMSPIFGGRDNASDGLVAELAVAELKEEIDREKTARVAAEQAAELARESADEQVRHLLILISSCLNLMTTDLNGHILTSI